MKKLKIGRYSNGIEEFQINEIESDIASLFTQTGVNFLGAKKDDKITIRKSILISFLNDELKGFSLIED